ncbi:hypothetical protein TeGR_g1551 [Tetraparma gracilis]|uniref:Uncharacterized protein n=1 Tax=Tetraparma gracilis TaxID=2962635 RepID=A0ABQ6MCL0_9STRA|nr:hypothetical protein TeGR_g1551 [Tetraparma gracilis]
MLRNLLCCVKDVFGHLPPLSLPAVSTPLSLLPLFAVLLPLLPASLRAAIAKTDVISTPIFFLQAHPVFFLGVASLRQLPGRLRELRGCARWAAQIAEQEQALPPRAAAAAAAPKPSQGGKASGGKASAPSSPGRAARRSRSRTPTPAAKADPDALDPAAAAASLAVLRLSLEQHAQALSEKALTDLCCAAIGVCFTWLSTHSLHVSETPLLGGMDAVIAALCVMEAALAPLLFFMWRAASSSRARAREMELVADRGWDGEVHPGALAAEDPPAFKSLLDLVAAAASARDAADPGADEKTPRKQDRDALDERLYHEALASGFGSDAGSNEALYPWHSSDPAASVAAAFPAVYAGADALLNSSPLRTAPAQPGIVYDAVPLVQGGGERMQLEAYREYAYFALNATAFYGYLMAPVTYYGVLPALKLGASDAAADWWGNFAGDFCWTVEPLLVIFGGKAITWWLFRGGGEGGGKEKKD